MAPTTPKLPTRFLTNVREIPPRHCNPGSGAADRPGAAKIWLPASNGRVEERGGSGGRKRGAADLARRQFTGHIVHFVEQYYNLLRLHSALQYRTPDEFECAAAAATPPQPYLRATLSFPRYKEIYPDAKPMYCSGRRDRQPLPHQDEFPAEYSLASCSPAALASASSATLILHHPLPFVHTFSANGDPRRWGLR